MEMQKPLISVIIPIYNIENHLNQCVESIVNQTYKALEIILVDDGSTDGSPAICDSWAARDSRVKVIHKPNGGSTSARKAGIMAATGDYATYVDGDDWIEPEMYEVLYQRIGDGDLAISGVKRDYGKFCVIETCKLEDGVYEGTRKIQKIYQSMMYTGSFCERGIQPHIFNCLYRRELLLKNQLQIDDRIQTLDDGACLYPVMLDAEKIVIISQSFYHYQMRKGSIMDVNDGTELERYKILYPYLYKRFTEKQELRECLIRQLDFMMLYCLLLKEFRLLQNNESTLFPYPPMPLGSRLVIYGAGRFGSELMRYLKTCRQYEIVSWADENVRPGIDAISQVKKTTYDYILVAVLIRDVSEKIKEKLKTSGIPGSKILGIDENSINRKVLDVPDILDFHETV